MRKKANDVKRGGWSAHKLADESGYAIDTKQKLKQGDRDNKQLTHQDAPSPPLKTAARGKKRSTKRTSGSEQ